MEIIEDGLKLRQEILDDARKKAQRIIKNTDKEIKGLEKSNEEQKIKIQKNYEKQYKNTIDKNKNKILASIKTELQKKYISFAGNIIDEIYAAFQNEILISKKLAYNKFLKSIIKNSIDKIKSKSIIVGLSKEDYAKLNITDIIPVNYMDNVEVIEDNIKNGVIIYSSDKKQILRNTLSLFIESLKEETRTKIYTMLFSEISIEKLL